ncbi:hypothetical protein V8C86DRAFT_2738058 [Haematococcus lacustris]
MPGAAAAAAAHRGIPAPCLAPELSSDEEEAEAILAALNAARKQPQASSLAQLREGPGGNGGAAAALAASPPLGSGDQQAGGAQAPATTAAPKGSRAPGALGSNTERLHPLPPHANGHTRDSHSTSLLLPPSQAAGPSHSAAAAAPPAAATNGARAPSGVDISHGLLFASLDPDPLALGLEVAQGLGLPFSQHPGSAQNAWGGEDLVASGASPTPSGEESLSSLSSDELELYTGARPAGRTAVAPPVAEAGGQNSGARSAVALVPGGAGDASEDDEGYEDLIARFAAAKAAAACAARGAGVRKG